MSDFERCSELRDWRRAHAGDLPRRRSDNEYEQSLARWYSKASQRQHRALSSRPSERQLTPDETAHLDSIVRIAIESPAAAPVEPLRKRLRTKSSSVPDSAAPTSKSAGRTQRDRKQRASESSPAASADQLPQGLAQTWPRQQSPIDICGELILAFAQQNSGNALNDNGLEDAAASDRRQTQRKMRRDKKPRSDRSRSQETRKTPGNRRKQEKPRKSSSASPWRSGDADSGSGCWEEFWNSDSD